MEQLWSLVVILLGTFIGIVTQWELVRETLPRNKRGKYLPFFILAILLIGFGTAYQLDNIYSQIKH